MVGPGEPCLIDFTRPSVTTNTPLRMILVVIERAFLDEIMAPVIDNQYFELNGNARISFVTTRPGDEGPGQTAVPEPAIWLTMLVGMGLLGGVVRRRRAIGIVAA